VEEEEIVQDAESSADEFAPPAEEEQEEEVDESMDEEPIVPDDEEEADGSQVGSDEDVPKGESIIDVESDRAESESPGPGLPKRKKGPNGPFMEGSGKFKTGHGRSKTRSIPMGENVKIRQRILQEGTRGGQEARLKASFGPTHEDIYPVLQTRDYWKDQAALPSRSEGNLRRSFFVPEDAHEKEVRNTRVWYADAGQKTFAAGQETRALTEEEGRPYMANEGSGTMDLLMGDIKEPKLYTVEKGRYMSLSTPFPPKSARRGWMFYLGTRIQEVQWAPNEKGPTQYLAVAVEQKRPDKPKHKPLENPHAPAFTATKPFPASIQIWAFDSKNNGDMDPSKQPRLEHVICTDWGAPKAFRWWPVGARDTVVRTTDDGEMVRLGLLAGIWSDGHLRILDVSFQKPGPDVRISPYVHYPRAAFDVVIPDTIPTCVQWLSGTSLAVATASGNLAVWSLNRPGAFPSPKTKTKHFTPKPWLYKQIADTYILSLASGYPSHPHMLSITTGDGFARLFDLRSPSIDSCFAARGRMLVGQQAWHEQTQSFVMVDEYYLLKHSSLRRFYGNILTMRIDASLLCVATSPVQPCILIGGSDGMVSASNTIRKVLNSKDSPWQQPWFQHEWRRPISELALREKPTQSQSQKSPGQKQTSSASAKIPNGVFPPEPSASVHPSTLAKPLTRITEGYKTHRVGITFPDDSKRYKEGAKFLTIFEEMSAVSRVGWNPNLRFGTWAVAGTNSGYLRVEDVGLDEK
jgi:transcription factor C subunit 6